MAVFFFVVGLEINGSCWPVNWPRDVRRRFLFCALGEPSERPSPRTAPPALNAYKIAGTMTPPSAAKIGSAA